MVLAWVALLAVESTLMESRSTLWASLARIPLGLKRRIALPRHVVDRLRKPRDSGVNYRGDARHAPDARYLPWPDDIDSDDVVLKRAGDSAVLRVKHRASKLTGTPAVVRLDAVAEGASVTVTPRYLPLPAAMWLPLAMFLPLLLVSPNAALLAAVLSIAALVRASLGYVRARRETRLVLDECEAWWQRPPQTPQTAQGTRAEETARMRIDDDVDREQLSDPFDGPVDNAGAPRDEATAEAEEAAMAEAEMAAAELAEADEADRHRT